MQRGMTLIEVLVIAAIIAILALVAVPAIVGHDATSNITFGINGTTESRCVEGYKFVLDNKGNARQILDEFGKGVRCGTQQTGPTLSKP